MLTLDTNVSLDERARAVHRRAAAVVSASTAELLEWVEDLSDVNAVLEVLARPAWLRCVTMHAIPAS